MPSVCKDMVQVGLAYIASGSVKRYIPLKKLLDVSHKITHRENDAEKVAE